MKSKITAGISALVVLATGAAAAAINTQTLSLGSTGKLDQNNEFANSTLNVEQSAAISSTGTESADISTDPSANNSEAITEVQVVEVTATPMPSPTLTITVTPTPTPIKVVTTTTKNATSGGSSYDSQYNDDDHDEYEDDFEHYESEEGDDD